MIVFISLILTGLSVVTKVSIDRDQWMSPILSPALNSFFSSLIDALVIMCCDRRYPRAQRFFHDGAIFIGYAIANGFLVSFTIGDIQGTAEGSTPLSAVVAKAALFFMFLEM
jgi:hypothetical protein